MFSAVSQLPGWSSPSAGDSQGRLGTHGSPPETKRKLLLHFEQESGKVCFKRTPSACSVPCGGEAEKCQQTGEEWRATAERNGGSFDQGGVKAKSAQRPGRYKAC